MSIHEDRYHNKSNAKHDHKSGCDHEHEHDHHHDHKDPKHDHRDGQERHHSHHSHHDHDHFGHAHHHHGSDGSRRGLMIALIITSGILLLEFIGGLVTRSLALLSDSGHMLSDAASLLLSLVAVGFAAKAPSPGKTYGYYRFEILAALINGITLVIVSGFILWEAIGRLQAPPEVSSGWMMLIACVGLLANLASAWSLLRQGNLEDNLNVRSAYLHVMGDALGSVGALLAGAVMALFGWYIADPIISMIVALLILKSAWGILNRSVHILMEGTPSRVDQNQVKESLLTIEGVLSVHDVHIWSLTSGMDAFSCHLVIRDEADSQTVLQAAIEAMAQRFHITHTTIQVETARIQHAELH
ncbi:cation diffusion facilitator family transporter [Paenibacillus sp. HJGM_3]|uniref:cation diffusion facilitator family transporter n=1 Tax=Paenibacillus sp. HJGM_3 TaxID=3379816 RepID=UPI00385B0F1A